MSFEYTVEDVTTEDGEGSESVTFVLKDVGKVPVGVLRRNRRNQEAAIFATFEWGLDEDQLDAFDRLDATQLAEMLQAWQESGEGDQDKPKGRPKTPKANASE